VFDIIPQPIPFSLYLPCINPAQSVEGTATKDQVRLWSEADHLVIGIQEGTLREVTVLDAQGRLVAQARASGPVLRLSTSTWATGVVLVRVINGGGYVSTHRFVLEGRN
jgi:hypothetical protein